jgi:redox-sensitive bicupin YhaK (pirin superfamily)
MYVTLDFHEKKKKHISVPAQLRYWLYPCSGALNLNVFKRQKKEYQQILMEMMTWLLTHLMRCLMESISIHLS